MESKVILGFFLGKRLVLKHAEQQGIVPPVQVLIQLFLNGQLPSPILMTIPLKCAIPLKFETFSLEPLKPDLYCGREPP
jgi:hypothetical protein